MASNTIKGLTVEIGGDTTKLGDALEKVNKKSKDLSSELGQINKLLKMDPKNTDLLAQKQTVLSQAIATTANKLNTLKEAEKQVQRQFEKGEASEEQVRALQREIISTEKKMGSYEKAIKETSQQLKGHGQATDEAREKTGKFGDTAKAVGAGVVKAFAGVTAVIAAAGAALAGTAEATREYRTEMGKLDAAFTTAGHNTEAAKSTYKALQGVLGETDQAVEAANHLAKLTNSEQELQKWTDICTGVYATFGASLPIEGLTEAANETAKVGKVTGPLADALNWAGVSEDAFNESLAECNTEQERQTLIMETLNGLYDDAATKYREVNGEVIRANEANEAWTATLAEVGGAVEPVLTDVKALGTSLLSEFVPGLTAAADAFHGLIKGEEGATQQLGAAISDIASQLLTKLTQAVPAIVETGVSLVVTLSQSIIGQLPTLVETITGTLVSSVPQLIQGATTLLMAIVDSIPKILPPLIKALPAIIMCIINGLLEAVPQLIDGALTLLLAIVDAIPLLIEQLVPMLPQIITTIINALLDATPQLIRAAFTLLSAIAKAIPQACAALVKSLPQIWSTIGGYLKTLPEKVAAIGEELVAGIWKGIKAKINWLKDKITGFGKSVTGFFKSVFGINSPSKVTAYMGEMLDEGLAVGIEGNAKAPEKAMRDVSADVINAVGRVDGLSVERSVNHAVSVNAAMGTHQNAGMLSKLDQILQAIERGQILTLDGNALVGGTANKMNNALGQHRILAERGAI